MAGAIRNGEGFILGKTPRAGAGSLRPPAPATYGTFGSRNQTAYAARRRRHPAIPAAPSAINAMLDGSGMTPVSPARMGSFSMSS